MGVRQALPVTITVPPGLLAKADSLARKEGRSRSGLFREGLRALMWKRRWESLQAYGSRVAKKKGLKEADIEGIVDRIRS
jgi:metal-responsive CopG/Arc/MetJ family transcriptional regulator